MPAHKGSYNARAYHEGEADVVEAALQRSLASEKAGTVFNNVSALAAHVAPACGRTAGQLRRNPRYRALLEAHLGRQPGAVGLLKDDTRSVPVLRAKLAEYRLRIANLQADKRRLENFVARHIPNAVINRPAAEKSSKQTSDYLSAFECTASALDAVIRHAEVYKLDKSSGDLIDLAGRPDSPPVVRNHLLTYFVDWQRNEQGKT